MTVTVEQIVSRRPRRQRRLWFWSLLALLLAGGGYYGYSRYATPVQTTYATTAAAPADITVTVTAVGTVQPVQTVDVTAEVAGTITAVPVSANQTVKKGQALVTIDTAGLEATLARDKAALAVQTAALAQAQVSRDQSAQAFDRAQKMAARGITTQEALGTAEADAKRAEAGLAAAQAQKAVAEADLALAQVNLDKACICAPIDGVVLSSAATVGEAVTASAATPLFTLAADLDQMQLKLDVDEADIGTVKQGDSAAFTVEAYQDRTFAAQVTEIAYASQTVDDVVTYSTTLSIDNSDGLLRPGMTAAADITVEQARQVLAVPNAAFRYSPPVTSTRQRGSGLLGMLFSRPAGTAPVSATAAADGTRSLWVLRAGLVTEVKVKTGVTDGTLTQILEGDLAPGDAVITGTVTKS